MKQTDKVKSDREIIADLKQQRQQRQQKQKQKQAGPGAGQRMLPPPTALGGMVECSPGSSHATPVTP